MAHVGWNWVASHREPEMVPRLFPVKIEKEDDGGKFGMRLCQGGIDFQRALSCGERPWQRLPSGLDVPARAIAQAGRQLGMRQREIRIKRDRLLQTLPCSPE